MDFVQLLVAVVLGGVFGGMGGLVAQAIGKRFAVNRQMLTAICGLAGFAIAYAVTPIVRNALSGEPSNATAPARISEIDQQFKSRSRLFRFIADAWPAEYQTFLADLSAQPNQAAINRLANTFSTKLRQSNAAFAVYAPDPELRAYFRTYQLFLADIKSGDGDAVCADVLNRGPTALGDRAIHYLAHIDELGLATMTMLREGGTRSESGVAPTPDVTDADLSAFDAFLIDRTGEQGLVLKLRAGTDKDLCSIGIRVMQALSEFAPDQPVGRALRTSTFHNIAAA